MDTQEIIDLFGSYATDEKLVSFLRKSGITERPKLPKGEFDAYLGMKKHGLCLIFEDEAYLKNQKKPIGRNPLVLIGAYFYSRGQEGYSEYSGSLPGRLEFGDSREKAVQKLGESEWRKDRNGIMLRERWTVSGKKLLVHYGPDAGSIAMVYIGTV